MVLIFQLTCFDLQLICVVDLLFDIVGENKNVSGESLKLVVYQIFIYLCAEEYMVPAL